MDDTENDGIPRTSIVCFASLALIFSVFLAVAMAFKCCKITPDPLQSSWSMITPTTDKKPPLNFQNNTQWTHVIPAVNGAVKSASFAFMKRNGELNEWFV